ncbi:3-KETOACYL-COA SYNTHASE [Salix purpurea]|uniref:3-ketoacyl-CoA synthase n=1 Tax=Salix purpurea TaxID=77065 RepID=A0A9Q1AJN0_SALPP|nr:3-KETOACYL-COA SYNTHASE [Salix purpurea]
MASNDLQKFIASHLSLFTNFIALVLLCLTLTILLLSKLFESKPSRKVFLLDFACYKPPASQMWSKELTMEIARHQFSLSKEALLFMEKLLEKSGLGPSTYLPEAFRTCPPNECMEEVRKESETVIFGAVDDVLAKTGVKGKDIGIVIVNCCLFNTAPSLSAMIVNRYKLGDKVVSYNLSGMGCSAGLAAIGLAKQLLQVHGNSYALVVSTENITGNRYQGEDRSMILINCLFRIGGAAILLSNRPSDRHAAKYQLIHAVHTNTAASDSSYNCISSVEDSEGLPGVSINKSLMPVVVKTIEANLTTLGHLVLPISEKILFIANYIARHFHSENIKPYVPDFMKAIDHIITHVGGQPVLDEVERNLRLSKIDMEASRMTLYRFGNTSSSSVWYGLAYIEAKGRVKRGDRVWQIAFGSGFKCNSLIMKATRDVDLEENNPWSDEIDGFPVDLKSADGAFPYDLEPAKQI